MRRLLLGGLLCISCDTGAAVKSEPDSKAQDDAPPLPTPDEVCAAYKTAALPDNVFVLSATTTKGSIKANFDNTAAHAEITELRAESEPPAGEWQMHKGLVHSRRLTLTKADAGWKVDKDEVTSHNEIFYVRRPVGDDPSKLFGAQVVERYGPKGGITCIGEPPKPQE